MSNYSISLPLLQTPVEVQAGAINSTYSLKLVGRGAPGYGLAFAENTLKQLSNFASGAGLRPSNPLVGQLWYNDTTKNLQLHVGTGRAGADADGWVTILSGSQTTPVDMTAKDVSVTGTLTVSGASSLSSLNVSGLGTINNLNVLDDATIGDGLTVNGGLVVVGNSTLAAVTASSLNVTGNLSVGGYITESVQAANAAGTTQAGATALTGQICVVGTVTPSANGVRLPTATAGRKMVVLNTHASEPLKVYAATSNTVNGAASFELGAGGNVMFIATSATTWYALSAVYA